MRPVKYRAWNVQAKEMCKVLMVYPGDTAIGLQWIDKNKNIWLSTTASKEGVELMEFTGLYDSQNIEVYEDDLINAGYGIGKIIFREGCFFIEWVDDMEANIEPLGWAKNNRPRTGFIVIGNIYETPQLIEH